MEKEDTRYKYREPYITADKLLSFIDDNGGVLFHSEKWVNQPYYEDAIQILLNMKFIRDESSIGIAKYTITNYGAKHAVGGFKDIFMKEEKKERENYIKEQRENENNVLEKKLKELDIRKAEIEVNPWSFKNWLLIVAAITGLLTLYLQIAEKIKAFPYN